MGWLDTVQSTVGSVKDGFIDLLKGVTDNYVEITKAVKTEGATGAEYVQGVGVENTGGGLGGGRTGNNWFTDNWLLIFFAIILLVGIIAAVKWVL